MRHNVDSQCTKCSQANGCKPKYSRLYIRVSIVTEIAGRRSVAGALPMSTMCPANSSLSLAPPLWPTCCAVRDSKHEPSFDAVAAKTHLERPKNLSLATSLCGPTKTSSHFDTSYRPCKQLLMHFASPILTILSPHPISPCLRSFKVIQCQCCIDILNTLVIRPIGKLTSNFSFSSFSSPSLLTTSFIGFGWPAWIQNKVPLGQNPPGQNPPLDRLIQTHMYKTLLKAA